MASMARVWFVTPPEPVRAAAEVQRFLGEVSGSEQGGFVLGGGRCKPEIAEALCIQTTEAFEALDDQSRAAAKASLTATWHSVAEINPKQLVFVGSDGKVQPHILGR